MDDIAEKRVFDDRTGERATLVAAADGLVRLSVSDGRVGEFTLVDGRPATDVASEPGEHALLVGTDRDVLVGTTLVETGFGPAVAVGFGEAPLAAGPDGRLARLVDGDWEELARLPDVRAIDGGLVATTDGVYRADGTYVGLDASRDVAAPGPLAATDAGLYRLGNGWQSVRDGPHTVVASDGRRAHAATADRLIARSDGGWDPVSLPDSGQVVDVGYGESVVVATADGQVLTSGDGRTDWRQTHLGVHGVRALAVA